MNHITNLYDTIVYSIMFWLRVIIHGHGLGLVHLLFFFSFSFILAYREYVHWGCLQNWQWGIYQSIFQMSSFHHQRSSSFLHRSACKDFRYHNPLLRCKALDAGGYLHMWGMRFWNLPGIHFSFHLAQSPTLFSFVSIMKMLYDVRPFKYSFRETVRVKTFVDHSF